MTKPITSFVVLALTAGFIFFYVVPEYKLNNARRSDVESLTKTLSAFSEIRMLVDKTKKNLSSIDSAEMSRFGVFLPEKVDELRFANNIQSIGTRNKISVTDIKVEGPTKGLQKVGPAGGSSNGQGLVNALSISDKATEAKISGTTGATTKSSSSVALSKKIAATTAKFSFAATYESFQLFLNDLEKSLGLMDITSLYFIPLPESATAKNSKTSAPLIYQFTVEMETYSLK